MRCWGSTGELVDGRPVEEEAAGADVPGCAGLTVDLDALWARVQGLSGDGAEVVEEDADAVDAGSQVPAPGFSCLSTAGPTRSMKTKLLARAASTMRKT